MSDTHRKDAKTVAAEAAIAAAVAQARQRRAEARAAYEERTRELLFVKEFQSFNLATMQDPFESAFIRYLAWARRYSWGEWSLFAIAIDGHPKHQVDACNELGFGASTISKAHKYGEQRGYLEQQPKLVIPVINPVLSGPAENGGNTPEWGAFLELWKVAHSTDFENLEVARATVDQIRKVRLVEYKKWREQERNARASLLEIAREGPGEAAKEQSQSLFERDVERHKLLRAAQRNPVDEGLQLQARTLLFAEILRMQKAYPDTSFANPPIDPRREEHQRLVSIILDKIGTDQDDLVGYVAWVAAQFKGLGGDAEHRRKRKPGTSGGPDTLGLLVNWAEDYARVAGTHSSGASGDD